MATPARNRASVWQAKDGRLVKTQAGGWPLSRRQAAQMLGVVESEVRPVRLDPVPDAPGR